MMTLNRTTWTLQSQVPGLPFLSRRTSRDGLKTLGEILSESRRKLQHGHRFGC